MKAVLPSGIFQSCTALEWGATLSALSDFLVLFVAQMLSDHLIDRVVLQSLNYSLHHHPDNPHVIHAPSRSGRLTIPPHHASADHKPRLQGVTIEQP